MLFISLIFCGFIVIHGAILGEQNKNAVLPCSFTPGGDEVIHWTTSNNKNVHSYYKMTDQLDNQDKDYSGRTSLFLNEISKGNASLQIRNLKESDGNTYTCYVGTKTGKIENEIILKVIGAILGEQNKDVILPCSFTPRGEEVIHWTTSNNKNVHSYYKRTDQLEKQDKDYSGRTSLFLNDISKGNASLQIRNLKKSDENTYTCYVGTKEEKTENEIMLQVIDIQHTIEHRWDDTGQLNLTCSVNVSSPEEITVKWYENDQKVQEDQSAKSSYTVKNKSLKHECTVDHSIVHSRWTGTWTMKETMKKRDAIFTCGCNFCNATNSDFYVTLYLRQGTNEVTIASMDNSLLNVSTYYSNKIAKYEEHNMHLSKLNANDSGLYICLTKTEQKMNIEMTPINITAEEETPMSRSHIGIAAVPVSLVIAIGSIINFSSKNKKEREKNLSTTDDTGDDSSHV